MLQARRHDPVAGAPGRSFRARGSALGRRVGDAPRGRCPSSARRRPPPAPRRAAGASPPTRPGGSPDGQLALRDLRHRRGGLGRQRPARAGVQVDPGPEWRAGRRESPASRSRSVAGGPGAAGGIAAGPGAAADRGGPGRDGRRRGARRALGGSLKLGRRFALGGRGGVHGGPYDTERCPAPTPDPSSSPRPTGSPRTSAAPRSGSSTSAGARTEAGRAVFADGHVPSATYLDWRTALDDDQEDRRHAPPGRAGPGRRGARRGRDRERDDGRRLRRHGEPVRGSDLVEPAGLRARFGAHPRRRLPGLDGNGPTGLARGRRAGPGGLRAPLRAPGPPHHERRPGACSARRGAHPRRPAAGRVPRLRGERAGAWATSRAR